MKHPELYVDYRSEYAGQAPYNWHVLVRDVLPSSHIFGTGKHNPVFISEWWHPQTFTFEAFSPSENKSITHYIPYDTKLRFISVFRKNESLSDLPQGLYTESNISIYAYDTIEIAISDYWQEIMDKVNRIPRHSYMDPYIERMAFLHGMRSDFTAGMNVSSGRIKDEYGYITEHLYPKLSR